MARRKKPNPFSSQDREPQPMQAAAYEEDEFYDEEFEEAPVQRRTDEHKVFGLGIQNADERQPMYGQGVVFALIIAAALLLCAIIAIGDGDGSLPPMLQRSTPLLWGVSIFSLVLSAVGAQYSDSVARRATSDGESTGSLWLSTAWVIPFIAVFASVLLIATYHNRWMLLFGPLLAFVGMAGALFTRDLLEEADEPSMRTATVISGLVGILVAFFAYGAVYLNKFTSPIAVPIVAIITFLLLLEALARTGVPQSMRVLQALLGAWILAATMIALNWWPTWGWVGAGVLTGMYYMVYGLLVTNAEGKPLSRNKMLEFVGIGSLLLLVLALRDVIL